jgi:hypothetical protein
MSSFDGRLPRLRGGAAGKVLYLKVEDWRCIRVGFASGCSRGLVEVVRRGASGRISSSVAVFRCIVNRYVAIYGDGGRVGGACAPYLAQP